MTNQEKLDISNGMEIIDEDCGGGELVYVLVEYSDENIEKISKVVPEINEYLKNVGDPDGTKEAIDICIAAFQHAGADYYHNGKFVIFTKDQLMEMYEEEKCKRVDAEIKLSNVKARIKQAKSEIQLSLETIG